MLRTVLSTSLVLGLVSGVASSDVLMTFDFGIAEDDGGSPLDGSYGGSLELIVSGVNAVGDMDGSYQVELTVDYIDAYDPWELPLTYEGSALATRNYQDGGDGMIWDMVIAFDVGGTSFPWTGTSTIWFADVVATDPKDSDDTYSYGLPGWSTTGDDGSGGYFYIDYSSMTETVIPAPAALALLGLAGIVGSRRRRH